MEPQEEHNEAEKGKRNMEKLFNLQVFAQENTQTTGGLSAEMKTYYGMELLDNAKPQLVHNQFAATKPLPTGGGKTVEWRKFGSFDKALTPLTEGVTPDGSGISVSYITKELAQYGDYTTVSDMLDLTAIDDVVLEITDRHGANMGLTLDTVTRNEIQQGKQVLYAPAIGADGSKTEVTARGALTAACRLTSEMVAKAATQLKKMNAPTFDGIQLSYRLLRLLRRDGKAAAAGTEPGGLFAGRGRRLWGKDPCGGAGLSAQEWSAGGRRGGQRDHGESVGPADPGYLRPQHQRPGALRRVG